MRWLADECVDASLVAWLRSAAHDVFYIAEIAAGATDVKIMRRAHDDNRLLLTEDKDFGELVFRLGMAVPGLVLLRFTPEKRLLKWTRLESAVGQFGEKTVWALSRHRGDPVPLAAVAQVNARTAIS